MILIKHSFLLFNNTLRKVFLLPIFEIWSMDYIRMSANDLLLSYYFLWISISHFSNIEPHFIIIIYIILKDELILVTSIKKLPIIVWLDKITRNAYHIIFCIIVDKSSKYASFKNTIKRTSKLKLTMRFFKKRILV